MGPVGAPILEKLPHSTRIQKTTALLHAEPFIIIPLYWGTIVHKAGQEQGLGSLTGCCYVRVFQHWSSLRDSRDRYTYTHLCNACTYGKRKRVLSNLSPNLEPQSGCWRGLGPPNPRQCSRAAAARKQIAKIKVSCRSKRQVSIEKFRILIGASGTPLSSQSLALPG